MRAMRIVLACPYAWDTVGGVQAHVRQLAAALRERGHNVRVAAPARASAAADPFVNVVGRTVGVPWDGSVVPLCFTPRSFWRLRALMRSIDPDVVHVHEPVSPSTAMLATLAATAPVVATFHAFSERLRVLALVTPLLQPVLRRIAVPLAVSPAAAERAARVVPEPLAIVPNGVHLTRFARSTPRAAGLPNGRVVLWVNRLEARKGFPVAVRAFARLASTLPDVHLVVVGDGPDRDAVALLSERERRRVVMVGTVSDDALPSYYAAADVFVAAATGQESFGVVLLEAMAARLPVVASDIRGYRDVVHHGVEGLLVPPNDPAALATALLRVLTQPRLAAALARAGHAQAGRHSWDVLVPRLETIYARVASARRERPPPERPPRGREQDEIEHGEIAEVPLQPEPRDGVVEHLPPRRQPHGQRVGADRRERRVRLDRPVG
jgi:phosphatidylinositol alpha-mannosyltransferase